MTREYYERRGTMVYTEETEPGEARFVCEMATVADAEKTVDLLNRGLLSEKDVA